jgi:predicted component of type VI protein secretion system
MTTSPKHLHKHLHAYLSDKAHAHWHEQATIHGTTVSALLEVLAADLEEILNDRPAIGLIPRARAEMARRNRRSDR